MFCRLGLEIRGWGGVSVSVLCVWDVGHVGHLRDVGYVGHVGRQYMYDMP